MLIGYIGGIGAGKTMCAVVDAAALAKRRGAILASNIKVVVPEVECRQLPIGRDGIDVGALEALMEESRARKIGIVLLVDEIGAIFPARAWAKFPVSVMFAVSQSRKLRVDWFYTSQDVEQVDAYIRRLTNFVYLVKSIPSPSIDRQERGKRPWFFRLTQWRPTSVGGKDKRLGASWRRYHREDEALYDTDELVRPAARLLSPAGAGDGERSNVGHRAKEPKNSDSGADDDRRVGSETAGPAVGAGNAEGGSD